MTRYKILDELLSNQYHNYSLDELTEEVNKQLANLYPNTNGVVRRTIEKDIFYLEYEGPFYVDIERYDASGYNKEKQKSYVKKCLRYSEPGFSIFKKSMNDDVKYLLGEALSLLGQFDGLPNLETLEGLRKELNVNRNDNKILLFSKNILENSNVLGKLFTSISQKQVIELHYHKFVDTTKEFVINLHPYLLKEYNRRWFLFAAAEDDEKLLCFSLDRIDKIVPLPSHNYVEYDGDLNEWFDDIIGVTLFENSPVYSIVFWVSDLSKDYVITKPIHDSQKNIIGNRESGLRNKYPMLQGGRFFQIECKNNYELIRELSSFGKDLLVLEPSEIQDKVWNRINAMKKDYENLRTLNS